MGYLMIPAFDPNTNALPAGIHKSDWAEFVTRFGYNAHRQVLLVGMKKALTWVMKAGGAGIYIGGSFVTSKGLR
jgi:hypothetical protein